MALLSLSHLRAARGCRCEKWKKDGASYRGIICELHIVVFVKRGLKMGLLPWSHPHATLGHRCLKWKKDGSSSWSHPRVVHCHLCKNMVVFLFCNMKHKYLIYLNGIAFAYNQIQSSIFLIVLKQDCSKAFDFPLT